MKKKLFLVIFSLLLLLGCRQPETESAETDNPEKEQPTFVFTQDMVVPYTAQTGETSFPVTINMRTREDEGWKHTYRNQTIDCADLRMEVLSFDPYSETEAMKLRVALPEDWDETLCKWASREGLHLRFEVDGKPVDAFRERVITVQNKYEFEVLYRKCILDEYALSGKLFSVRPYFSEWEGIYTHYHTKYCSLSSEETFSDKVMSADYVSNKDIVFAQSGINRHYPDGSAVSIRIHNEDDPALPAPQILRPVTFISLDYEVMRMETEESFEPKGSVRTEEMDFSKMSFVLDEFHIWQDEVKIVFSFKMPDDWDAEMYANLYQNLYFYAYTGDPEKDSRARRAKDSPFGEREMLPGVHTPDIHAIWFGKPTAQISELNYMEMEFVFTRDQWDATTELTITPFYTYYTDIILSDSEASVDVSGVYTNAIPIPPEGIRFETTYGVNTKMVWLDELAIHIPITEDLFDSGF